MPRSVLPLSRRPIKRRPLCPLALEPRLMFDGAAIDTAAQVAVDAAATASPGDSTDIGTPTADAAPSAPPATEIVFITTSTPEWQKLANNVRADVEVVLLDPERDGLAQINAALAGRTGITALHLVSHGADGLVLLGNTPLDTDTLNERTSPENCSMASGGRLKPNGSLPAAKRSRRTLPYWRSASCAWSRNQSRSIPSGCRANAWPSWSGAFSAC